MPVKTRRQVAPTEDIRQIALLIDSPPQARYEGLRPVVLFGQSAEPRFARQLSEQRTLKVSFPNTASLMWPSPVWVETASWRLPGMLMSAGGPQW
jgi:hypothetical protein